MPVALYGVVLLMAGFACWLLVRALIARHGSDSVLARAIGGDFKGNISLAVYLLGVLVAAASPRVSYALYVAVAILWLVPDRRIERVLTDPRLPDADMRP